MFGEDDSKLKQKFPFISQDHLLFAPRQSAITLTFSEFISPPHWLAEAKPTQ